jgi:hypothetical protein
VLEQVGKDFPGLLDVSGMDDRQIDDWIESPEAVENDIHTVIVQIRKAMKQI